LFFLISFIQVGFKSHDHLHGLIVSGATAVFCCHLHPRCPPLRSPSLPYLFQRSQG